MIQLKRLWNAHLSDTDEGTANGFQGVCIGNEGRLDVVKVLQDWITLKYGYHIFSASL